MQSYLSARNQNKQILSQKSEDDKALNRKSVIVEAIYGADYCGVSCHIDLQ